MMTKRYCLFAFYFSFFIASQVAYGSLFYPKGFSEPVIHGSSVYFTDENLLICYDLDNSKVRWQKRFDESIRIYRATANTVILRQEMPLNVPDGEIEDFYDIHLNIDNVVFTKVRMGPLIVLDAATGGFIDQYPVPDGSLTILSDSLTLVNDDGDNPSLSCFNFKSGQNIWTFKPPHRDNTHLVAQPVGKFVFVSVIGSSSMRDGEHITGINNDSNLVCLSASDGKEKWRESLIASNPKQDFPSTLFGIQTIGQWAVIDIGYTLLVIDQKSGHVVNRYKIDNPWKIMASWDERHLVIAYRNTAYTFATVRVLDLSGMQTVNEMHIRCKELSGLMVSDNLAIVSTMTRTEARDLTTGNVIWSEPFAQRWQKWAEQKDILYFTDYRENKVKSNEKLFGFLDPQTGKITILYRAVLSNNSADEK